MLKALVKKQLLEVFAWIYRSSKTGKRRTTAGIIGNCALYLLVFGFLGYFFYNMAHTMCGPLISAGYGQIFWAIMGLIALALGAFGSIFNTYATLYCAKDNDLLFAMPVTANAILTARLSGVYFLGLMYEAVVMIPVYIAFFVSGGAKGNIAGTVFSLFAGILISVAVLTVSCVLGYLVALINSRLKNKKIGTLIVSIVFFAGYWYVYTSAYEMIGKLIANPVKYDKNISRSLYVFYEMGLGCVGDFVPMLISTAIIFAAFFVVYFFIAKSFFKISTINKGSVARKYKAKEAKLRTTERALLYKELKRFTSSPLYMLNCGIGLLSLPVFAVVAVVNADRLKNALSVMTGLNGGILLLLITGVVCALSTTNDISAPSVSLEGKNIWILQSLPVKSEKVIFAKAKLHFIITAVPVFIVTAALGIAFSLEWYFILLSAVTALVFVLMSALLGVCLNLKMPNLNWTNEAVPIKQSSSVMISLFGGWGVLLLLAAVYYAVRKYIPAAAFTGMAALVFAAVSVLLAFWIKKKGGKIFSGL